MKPIETTDQYIGTSRAAKILGLSTGTVQKLVDSGVLSSFLTDGKHRRIQIQSLRDYCQRNRMPSPDLRISNQQMRLVIAPFDLENLANNYQDNDSIDWVCTPFDFIGLSSNFALLIFDARLEWLWHEKVKNFSFEKFKGKIIITSAQHCPVWVQEKFSDQLIFTRQDLSMTLIDSFFLVTSINQKIPHIHNT